MGAGATTANNNGATAPNNVRNNKYKNLRAEVDSLITDIEYLQPQNPNKARVLITHIADRNAYYVLSHSTTPLSWPNTGRASADAAR